MLRLFVAIPLPGQWQELLGLQQDRWRPVAPDISWVRPENLHLTLQFLGNSPAEKVPSIEAAVRDAALRVQAFEMALGSPGAFPTSRKPRVIWVGLEAPPTINELVQHLSTGLAAQGFAPESRAFRPHVTLGRRRTPRPDPALQRELDSAVGPAQKFKVESVTLFQSQLKPSGAVYSPLCIAPLKA